MSTWTAADLAPLLNAYSISNANPKTISVPQASRLAQLQDVTVSGTLLKKQRVTLDPTTNRRTITLGGQNGIYTQEQDGDLHFCLGTQQGAVHIPCELQNAAQWISTFNASTGQDMNVSGFFRCLFEHPGFHSNDDAHIFEIHPVRAVTLNGVIQPFDVDSPDPASIHTWQTPHDLNQTDNSITVIYHNSDDTLTFSGMEGMDENYISVSGQMSDIQLNAGNAGPSSFTFTSPDILDQNQHQRPLQVYCMQGTTAALQLSHLQAGGTSSISLIGLRNIDLAQALRGQYVINLLAIDMRAVP